jgi:hypothetical protein
MKLLAPLLVLALGGGSLFAQSDPPTLIPGLGQHHHTTIQALKPRAVIAGHKRPGNDDSPKIIEETRQYIRDFDRLAGTTATARELYDKMLELYPERVNPLPLWLSAHAAKA